MKIVTNISNICWSKWTKLNKKVDDQYGKDFVDNYCRSFFFWTLVFGALKIVVKTCKFIRKVKGK